MEIEEALDRLEDGHAIWKVDSAKKICETLGIPFDEKLVQNFKQGGYLTLDEEGPGVDGLSLGRYAAEKFGVLGKARDFIGRGYKAREYSRLIKEELQTQGRVPR